MDILKRLKMRVYALFAVSLGVAVIIGFGAVKAYQGIAPNINFESGATLNFESGAVFNEAPTPVPVEEELGATPGTEFLVDCLNFNGLETCFYSGGFNEASTTLFSVKNPFNATSVVEYLALQGRTGSTSQDIYAGTSTVASIPVHGDTASVLAGDMSGTLVNATEIATSSQFYIKNGNNQTNLLGQVGAGAGSLNSIVVGPTDYVIGYSSSTFTTDSGGSAPGDPNEDNSATTTKGAITGSENTFYGNYGFRIIKHQTPQID